MMTEAKTKKISIQERCRIKALDAYGDIENAIDDWPKKFDMYHWLNSLGYSPMVVKYMRGLSDTVIFELKNEENCPQLEEGYSHYTKKEKAEFLEFVLKIDSDLVEWLGKNKVVRKPRVRTPAQKVKKLNYLREDKTSNLVSIDPKEIIRAKQLFTYNVRTQRIACYTSYGLDVRGTSITGVEFSQEKRLTDRNLLDRLIEGGNNIAKGFMNEIKTKSKEPNNLINKNTILLKVVK